MCQVYVHMQVAEALEEKMPQKFIPYTFIKSIHLQSKVGSLKFKQGSELVASTDSKVIVPRWMSVVKSCLYTYNCMLDIFDQYRH